MSFFQQHFFIEIFTLPGETASCTAASCNQNRATNCIHCDIRILQCLVLMKFQNSHIGSYGKEGAMHMSVIMSICISVMSVNMNEQNAMCNREWVCFKEDSAFGIYIKLTRTCKQ